MAPRQSGLARFDLRILLTERLGRGPSWSGKPTLMLRVKKIPPFLDFHHAAQNREETWSMESDEDL